MKNDSGNNHNNNNNNNHQHNKTMKAVDGTDWLNSMDNIISLVSSGRLVMNKIWLGGCSGNTGVPLRAAGGVGGGTAGNAALSAADGIVGGGPGE